MNRRALPAPGDGDAGGNGFVPYWEERGSGPPLVLLHGNGEDGRYFVRQIGEFSRDHRVIVPDTRGHGRSPRGSAPFTLEQFSRDLEGFLDGLGIRKTRLLGFSDGGNVALLFALDHPERVEKLVLNGANLDPGGLQWRVRAGDAAGYGLATLGAPFSGRARRRREQLGLMVTQPRISPGQLGTLDFPVLVIAGTRDMIRDSHTRRIAGALPQGTLQLLPGGHFIARDDPESFNRAVGAFLR